jgi:hypothetical protein
MTAAGNPQLNRHGELNHLLTIEGLPRDVLTRILDTAAPFSEVAEREVKKVPLLARQERVQPVLREFDAHPHHLRDRGEAAFRRRHQPQHQHLLGQQGRDPARHGGQPRRDAGRHVRRAPCLLGRALPDRAAHGRHRARPHPCRQCRRRPPCAPDAGPARHVHHPPLQEGFQPADGGRGRRRAALARGAQPDPCPDHAGRARSARHRAARPCCRPASSASACGSSTICARACAASMW